MGCSPEASILIGSDHSVGYYSFQRQLDEYNGFVAHDFIGKLYHHQKRVYSGFDGMLIKFF